MKTQAQKQREEELRAKLETKPKDVRPEHVKDFSSFNLREDLLKGLYDHDFFAPTLIQERTLQYSLSGKNIIGRSKNGTGKTGAYLIPILNKLDLSLSKPQALILSSSRELANQIADECKQIGKFMNVQVMSCIGGEAVSNDVLRLKQTVHVITATLGRITSLAEQGLCDLSQCKIVVLDEVDHLLGFNSFGNLEKIMSFVPKTAQILAFSATFPESIKNDLNHFVPSPIFITGLSVSDTFSDDDDDDENDENDDGTLKSEFNLEVLPNIDQFFCRVDPRDKLSCLKFLIKKFKINQMVIFCNAVTRARNLAAELRKLGIPCLSIDSMMSQEDRNRTLYEFKHGTSKYLVCTDLISRGIDNQRVNIVVNFDMPNRSDTYLQRIGRTGRYGCRGVAVSMVTMADAEKLRTFESELHTRVNKLPRNIDETAYI